MKIEVRVLQLRGETGLRKPGSSYLLDEITAVSFEGHGWVEIINKPKHKEEKAKIETKEEKFVKVAKVTKGKPGRKKKA